MRFLKIFLWKLDQFNNMYNVDETVLSISFFFHDSKHLEVSFKVFGVNVAFSENKKKKNV